MPKRYFKAPSPATGLAQFNESTEDRLKKFVGPAPVPKKIRAIGKLPKRR